MGTTSGYTPEKKAEVKTVMDIQTEILEMAQEEPVSKEITENELLEFDKMFDDFKMSKIVNETTVVRVKPDIKSGNTSLKAQSIRSGKNSPHKSKSVIAQKEEPIIRDGWLEITEASGILRRGTVFTSLNSLLTECKFSLSQFPNFFSQDPWKETDWKSEKSLQCNWRTSNQVF